MTTPVDTPPSPASADRGASGSPGRATIRRLVRNPGAILGILLVAGFVFISVFAGALAEYPANYHHWADDVTLMGVPGPRPGNPLGIDSYGADLLSQLIFGARQSLIVGVVSTVIGLVVGASLGIVAGGCASVFGRVGRVIDNLVMRLVDIMLSIPSLLLAVSIVAVMGPGSTSLMVAIGMVQVPIVARLLRGSMLAQGRSDYVLAADALGLRKRTIVMSQMVPNAIGPTIVQATLNLATAIIEVAALSYLGLSGGDVTAAEWGRMLTAAQERFSADPQLALWPGFAIVLSALGFTLLGEALRDALDPKGKR